MKKIHLLMVLISGWVAGFAQISSNSVSGRLTDAEKKSPVEFAGVMLLNPQDSTIVQGGMTDRKGYFTISEIPDGKYLLKTLILGYRDRYSEPFTLKKDKNVDLGNIALIKDEQVLQGAEIVYVRPLFEQKAGKTVMNVESHPSAAGDNVIELLRKMPGVTVDNNDNISIQGKAGALVLIDDRDPHLSGDDLTNYLKNMPSSATDRIEVIKNPSARYDAAGTAGIINIVTKKDKNKGVNGSVWAGTGYHSLLQANTGFNLNARLAKFGFTGSGYYRYNPYENGRSSEFTSIYRNVTNRQTMNENPDELWNGLGNRQSYGFNVGIDYFIDKRNSLSLSCQGNLGLGKSHARKYNRIYQNNELQSNYLNEDVADSRHGNYQINFNCKHDFDTTGKTLYADITYSINNSLTNNYSNIEYFSGNFEGSPERQMVYHYVNNPNQMQVMTAKLDYEHPFNDKISLECGVKAGVTRNKINSDNFLNDSILQSYSNHFKYSENIYAAYLLGNFAASSRVSLQVGLRAEYTHVRSRLLHTHEVNTQNYIDLFPSFQIDYNFPKMNTLSVNYRSRINRPGYWQLNPFIHISDSYNISCGNPNLKPAYIHSVSLEHSWKYRLFTSIGYHFTQGTPEQMLFTDKQTRVRLSIPQNIGKSHAFYASIFARIPIGKWWMMMYSVDYHISRSTFDYEDKSVSRMLNFFSLYTSWEFTFCKNYGIELAAYWNPQSQTTFGTTDGRIYAWGGFKAQFLKKKLTVRLGVNDILNNNSWKYNNTYPDGSTLNEVYFWRSRSVNLNISYRFGKQEIKMHRRKAGNEDEFNRMNNSDGNYPNRQVVPRH